MRGTSTLERGPPPRVLIASLDASDWRACGVMRGRMEMDTERVNLLHDEVLTMRKAMRKWASEMMNLKCFENRRNYYSN